MRDRTDVRPLIRVARDDDLPALKALTDRCWRANYADLIPAETLAMLLAGDDGERWRTYRERWGGERWVAERGGAEAHLRERGFGRAHLWVVAAASATRGFYERCGWAPDGATRPLRPGDVETVRYRRSL